LPGRNTLAYFVAAPLTKTKSVEALKLKTFLGHFICQTQGGDHLADARYKNFFCSNGWAK